MANKLKLPEETLMKLGFRLLDITYGELTVGKGEFYDEVFFDGDGKRRLAYYISKLKKRGSLGYIYKDSDFFLSVIPVEVVDYERVLRAWFEERYNREADITWEWGDQK